MDPAVSLLRTLVLLVLAVLGAVSPGLVAAAPAVEGPRVLILRTPRPRFLLDPGPACRHPLGAGHARGAGPLPGRVPGRQAPRHFGLPGVAARVVPGKKYRDTRFDGIIVTDNHALELVARHRVELFPRTPVVACGINDSASIPAGVDDLYSIIENLAHTATLTAALRQNPGTRKIFVLVDATP